jgi:hypothetical protein
LLRPDFGIHRAGTILALPAIMATNTPLARSRLLELRLRRELAALFLRHGVRRWHLGRAPAWRLEAEAGPVLALARVLLRRRLRAWSIPVEP